jgi:dihydroorotate dehydrogenase
VAFAGRIGHLEDIQSPWGNAGGVAKSVEDVEALARTGVGLIEGGSFTLESRLGNAVDPEYPERGAVHKVYDFDRPSGKTTNSLGMPNHGLAAELEVLPHKNELAERSGKIYAVNVAPVSNDAVTESRQLVEATYAGGARAVLLNAGCPNVVTPDGGRHEILSRQPYVLSEVLQALKRVTERFSPIFIRLSPVESYWQMKRVCEVIRQSGVVSAVFVPNTWPGHQPPSGPLEVPGGVGGRSGPAMANSAAQQTQWAVQSLHSSNIDVVSCSGIMNAQELKKRLHIGAVAASGTTFYYESADWQGDTDRLLTELAELEA